MALSKEVFASWFLCNGNLFLCLRDLTLISDLLDWVCTFAQPLTNTRQSPTS